MLIIGLEGTELTEADRARLMHPAVVGAILFSRNIVDREQSIALIEDIRASRETPSRWHRQASARTGSS